MIQIPFLRALLPSNSCLVWLLNYNYDDIFLWSLLFLPTSCSMWLQPALFLTFSYFFFSLIVPERGKKSKMQRKLQCKFILSQQKSLKSALIVQKENHRKRKHNYKQLTVIIIFIVIECKYYSSAFIFLILCCNFLFKIHL